MNKIVKLQFWGEREKQVSLSPRLFLPPSSLRQLLLGFLGTLRETSMFMGFCDHVFFSLTA